MNGTVQQAIDGHRSRVAEATALFNSAMHAKARADRAFDMYRKNCMEPTAPRYMSIMLRASSLFVRRMNQHTQMIIDLSHRIATLEVR